MKIKAQNLALSAVTSLSLAVGIFGTQGHALTEANQKTCKVFLMAAGSGDPHAIFFRMFSNYNPTNAVQGDFVNEMSSLNRAVADAAMARARYAVGIIDGRLQNQAEVAFLVRHKDGAYRILIGPGYLVPTKAGYTVSTFAHVEIDPTKPYHTRRFGKNGPTFVSEIHHRIADSSNQFISGPYPSQVNVFGAAENGEAEIIPYADIVAYTSDINDRTSLFKRKFPQVVNNSLDDLQFIPKLLKKISYYQNAFALQRETDEYVNRLKHFASHKLPLAVLVRQDDNTQALKVGVVTPIIERGWLERSITNFKVELPDGTTEIISPNKIILLNSQSVVSVNAETFKAMQNEFSDGRIIMP